MEQIRSSSRFSNFSHTGSLVFCFLLRPWNVSFARKRTLIFERDGYSRVTTRITSSAASPAARSRFLARTGELRTHSPRWMTCGLACGVALLLLLLGAVPADCCAPCGPPAASRNSASAGSADPAEHCHASRTSQPAQHLTPDSIFSAALHAPCFTISCQRAAVTLSRPGNPRVSFTLLEIAVVAANISGASRTEVWRPVHHSADSPLFNLRI